MRKKTKEMKGITLIALVITIIVLLILAGVSINILFGDNGIITKAQKAAEDYNRAAEEENAILEEFLNYMESGNWVTGGTNEPTLIANKPDIDGFDKSTTYYVEWDITKNPYEIKETKMSETELSNWYNYGKSVKKWANIKTTGGGNDCYWVWIPRYAYKVPSKNTPSTIDVKFLNGKTNVPIGETEAITNTTPNPDEWVVHPAFTNAGNGGFGELSGIWVAKFEASSSSQTSNFVNNDTAFTTALADTTNYGGSSADTDLQVRVVPNVVSWRHITVSNIFTVCQALTNENNSLYRATGADPHMMKNSEWGAVAYLSRSQYGKNGKVANNNYYHSSSNASITGVTTNSDTAVTATGTLSKYNSDTGVNASTSGNVYGVYDMAGGVWEYVAGYVNNSNVTSNGYNTNLLNANLKYRDVYTQGATDTQENNYNANTGKYGDAVYETSTSHTGSNSWDGDFSDFPSTTFSVFRRGGHAIDGSIAGVFAFNANRGGEDWYGFRPVVVFSQ